MIKLDRRPEYHPKANLRVISMPNGVYAVQTRTRPSDFRDRRIDPWETLYGAGRLGYDQARMRMEAESGNYKP